LCRQGFIRCPPSFGWHYTLGDQMSLRNLSIFASVATLGIVACGKPETTNSQPSTIEETAASPSDAAQDGMFLNDNPFNSTLPGCVAFQKTCGGPGGKFDAAGTALNISRELPKLLTKLNSTDKAILSCSSVITKDILKTAEKCGPTGSGCTPETWIGAYESAAKTACSVYKCLSLVNKAAEIGSGLCDAAKAMGAGIQCFGYSGQGGLYGLCQTEMLNAKPGIPLECPFTSTVAACSATGGRPDESILKDCGMEMERRVKSGMITSRQVPGCVGRCVSKTYESRSRDCQSQTHCSNKPGSGQASFNGVSCGP